MLTRWDTRRTIANREVPALPSENDSPRSQALLVNAAIEVRRLHLTDVTPAPHLAWARPSFPVFAYLVLGSDAPILIDTGVGLGNAFIDENYAPVHYDLDEALGQQGVAVGDVETVITSHLHFDHCGQNDRFGSATIVVQAAEIEAAREPFYTVPDWAFPSAVELTPVDGDHQVGPGVRIIATPGHTAGHQSVIIDGEEGSRTIVCCQAAWDIDSFNVGKLGDDGWDQAAGAASLAKLQALRPDRVLLSHDPNDWTVR